MSRLLIVHHTPSPHCQAMFEAVVAGATDPEIEGVDVVRRAAPKRFSLLWGGSSVCSS